MKFYYSKKWTCVGLAWTLLLLSGCEMQPELVTRNQDAGPDVNYGTVQKGLKNHDHPDSLPDTFVNSVGITMKKVPAGTFQYGPGKWDVTIDSPFYIGVYEITGDQYAAIMGGEGGPEPKSCSWAEAVDFCQKLSVKEGMMYMLPTGREWEYACHAGTKTNYSFGDGWSEPESRKPNAWGIYDMHGNVAEYSQDWALPGIDRLVKGGSWKMDPVFASIKARMSIAPYDTSVPYVGFRVLMVMPK